MSRQPPAPETSRRRFIARLVGAFSILVAGAVVALVPLGCARETPPPITLATTAVVKESGLLDVLLPMFRSETGIEVAVIPSGSFRALELGRKGEADVLLVAEPFAEDKFMKEGHGSFRQPVMHSHFLLLGPAEGPVPFLSKSGKGGVPVVDALVRIADAGAFEKERKEGPKTPFLSHNDEAGIVRREVELLEARPQATAAPWHIEVKPEQGDPLHLADEKGAYVLTDRPPVVAQKAAPHLQVIVEGDPALTNPYSVILVNPDKHPRVRAAAARKFAEFLRSPAAQKAIADFRIEQDNRQFFFPDGTVTLN